MQMKEGDSSGNSRSGKWKTGTVRKRQQSIEDLVLYFGEQTSVDQIDPGAAEDWLHWMIAPEDNGRGLSPATASKKLKDARQFYKFAQRKQLTAINLFDGIRLPPQDNPDRLAYVERASIERVLEQVTAPGFRLLIAPGRYAGFRIPSEIQGLQWGDINFDKKTIKVTAPKKSGDTRAGQRVCRLFDELVPFLDAVAVCDSERIGNVLPSLCTIQRENFRT